ncbi:DUF3422 family protein [Roseitranquillus sediminis]|uniref:DUF3422 family protein n=1 Tax=Roseitranquillus sediminis TaxID=2809051 RepID=UPI001D0C5F21|nr:DUF3422 domain-containing protein [Roseitranquillus sediminis]MBM9595352.1 DUF3422 domain-containing protein [Roseitranquillus sediminis]
MPPIEEHPLRFQLTNELHARPFPSLDVPCRAAFLAVKRPRDAASRDREADRGHLVALLDRYGAPHPQPGATHYSGIIGRHLLKWESHTEFVSYTIFEEGNAEAPFHARTFSLFPDEWLSAAPGVRMTSALIRVEPMPADETVIGRKLGEWFVPESLAVSRVVDDAAIMASDFRIDATGHVRMAVFVRDGIGPRRTGRIVQRLCEIETYKTMSMLGLARARGLADRMAQMDRRLTGLMSEMTGEVTRPDETLKELLDVSAELEKVIAEASFRFGATAAYEALVNQRIEVMREERVDGRQTFTEFMMRRFDPAMRTVKSTERRLHAMAERASRAGNLLRTRVDVERSAQNRDLLESMNRRADLQLRLQKTVEGLSVVAISYYALNLVRYLAYPFAPNGWGEGVLTAALVPPVVLVVWLTIRSIRRKVEPE